MVQHEGMVLYFKGGTKKSTEQYKKYILTK